MPEQQLVYYDDRILLNNTLVKLNVGYRIWVGPELVKIKKIIEDLTRSGDCKAIRSQGDAEKMKILVKIRKDDNGGRQGHLIFPSDSMPDHIYLFVDGVDNVQIRSCTKTTGHEYTVIEVEIDQNPYNCMIFYAFF